MRAWPTYVLTTDEIYGTFTDPTFGCPWGWSRLISIRDPAHPVIVGEYKIPQDTQAFCGSAADDPLTEQFTSYSSHNPTVLPHLAFIDWHSGGVQAIDITNPASPRQADWYSPVPLTSVATEDPALNRGPNKVTMWSYPIIRDGLIYVMDIRNGLSPSGRAAGPDLGVPRPGRRHLLRPADVRPRRGPRHTGGNLPVVLEPGSVIRVAAGAIILAALGPIAPLIKVWRVDPMTVFRS